MGFGRNTRRELIQRSTAGVFGAALASHLQLVERALAASALETGLPSTPSTIAFNAVHAARGCYANLTLGCPGNSGGVAIEGGSPANQDVFVGAEDGAGGVRALPFFSAVSGDPAAIDITNVARDYRLATDRWRVDDLQFQIVSAASGVPDPVSASTSEMRDGLLPAVLATVTLDNRDGDKPRRAFFGIRLPMSPTSSATITARGGATPGFVYDDGSGHLIGAFCSDRRASAAAGSDFPTVLTGATGGQGRLGLLRLEVPAGQVRTIRIAIAFWHGGTVITDSSSEGMTASYWYTCVFKDLDAVAAHALSNHARLAKAWQADNVPIDTAHLSPDQRFLLVHGVRSYFGSTGLFAVGDRPLWMVMEGEYRGMNTFDLTVDNMFFELRQNAWTVRNELDWYLERWSYTDHTNAVVVDVSAPAVRGFQPGTTVHDQTPQPGGLSVTHDMGGWGSFSSRGHSGYEQADLSGVASYMTSEELTNWILAALTYVTQSGDEHWASTRVKTLADCLSSLLNRDNPDPSKRDGLMSMETDRAGNTGREITTYDALDPSLGQARHSSYLTGKQWGACVCLAKFFAARGRPDLAAQARDQAHRIAETTVAAAKSLGYIPALFAADGQDANTAKVVPALEGLLYPLYGGAPEALDRGGEYTEYLATMRRHLSAVLQPGACLYPSGAWKISSTSDIGWLSKPFLLQHVARRILGLRWDAAARTCDSAYVGWCTDSQASPQSDSMRGADYWCFTDQFISEKCYISRYYPRGTPSALWLEEHPATARLATSAKSGMS